MQVRIWALRARHGAAAQARERGRRCGYRRAAQRRFLSHNSYTRALGEVQAWVRRASRLIMRERLQNGDMRQEEIMLDSARVETAVAQLAARL